MLVLGATSLLLAASCSELSAIDIGRCGNNVLDRGEDCDGFDHAEGTRCGSPRDGAKACRYACDPLCHEGEDCSSEDLCPSGYGCGVDGICRKPEGFAPTFTELGFVSALWVDVADLNRDGVDDIALLDSTGVRVETLSVDVGSRHTDRFQLTPVGRPAIADVDGDGLLDVLAPDTDGLTVLRGSSDGDLSPSLYPGIDLPLESFAYFPNDIIPTRTDTTPTWAGDEGMAMVELAPSPELPDGMTGFVHLSTTDAFLVPADLPRSPGDVLGRVAVGQLDPSSYASEAAVAFCDDVALHLYTFQAVDPDAVLPVLASHDTVALADGSRTVPCPSEGNASDYGEPFGVRLVQANPPVASDGSSALCCDPGCTSLAPGDDHPDLLVITDAGHQIAFGLGDGTFHDEACELAGPVVPSQSAAVHPELGSCLLLAVGQLDGDGRLDVVAPNGLWLSELRPVDEVVCDASGGGLPAVGPAESWYEATTADVNGDGHRDVVALSPSRGDVDVLLGTTGAVISRRLLPNLTPGRGLRPGDFDGDGVDDIAFVLAGAALLPGSDRLATIWGEAGSGPSEVTVLGTV
ncbi:MAG: VCBS repeat-containing protein, partial [Myxococcales bacterium]|nr:VCBS repeat-containing protein [Myxococcales bacterium]